MPLEMSVNINPPLRRFRFFTSDRLKASFFINADRMIRSMQDLTQRKFKETTPGPFEPVNVSVAGSWKKGFNRKGRNNVSGKVFSRHPASATLDTGATTHRPPKESLKPWLRAKHGLSGRQLDRVAYFLALKIKQQGLPITGRPKRIYTKAFGLLLPEFDKIVSQTGINIVARFTIGPFGKR